MATFSLAWQETGMTQDLIHQAVDLRATAVRMLEEPRRVLLP